MILFNDTPYPINEFSEESLKNGLTIYEVIRILNKQPIFLKDNLMRLDNSLKKSNIDIDVTSLKIKSSTAVTKGELVSSINVEPQGIKINTSKLLLDGDAGNKCQNPSFNAGDSDWYGGITVVSGVGSEAQYWGRTLANTYHFYGDEFNVTVF